MGVSVWPTEREDVQGIAPTNMDTNTDIPSNTAKDTATGLDDTHCEMEPDADNPKDNSQEIHKELHHQIKDLDREEVRKESVILVTQETEVSYTQEESKEQAHMEILSQEESYRATNEESVTLELTQQNISTSKNNKELIASSLSEAE